MAASACGDAVFDSNIDALLLYVSPLVLKEWRLVPQEARHDFIRLNCNEIDDKMARNISNYLSIHLV